jgi:Polyketide cyclase / dehydrase and lipid transport
MAGGTAALLLLPFGLGTAGFDMTAKPHVFVVRSSIEIAAPPEKVWKNVVSFSELPPPAEWYFKTGLAYPMRAHIDGSGPGAIRYCEFSTGPFVEPIEVWDEPRLLRFSVAQNPAPMEEWSPYAKVVPPHLHGHLISKQGQFLLTPLPNGHTLLEGTTWYQHGLWPETYWAIWSQAIIHRIHMRVLVHIKDLSEGSERVSRSPERQNSKDEETEMMGNLR